MAKSVVATTGEDENVEEQNEEQAPAWTPEEVIDGKIAKGKRDTAIIT
jgi:hypothetical protein